MTNGNLRRRQRVNLALRDAEWRHLEAALKVTCQRPTEFVRQAALERARQILSSPEQYGAPAAS